MIFTYVSPGSMEQSWQSYSFRRLQSDLKLRDDLRKESHAEREKEIEIVSLAGQYGFIAVKFRINTRPFYILLQKMNQRSITSNQIKMNDNHEHRWVIEIKNVIVNVLST